MSGIGNHGSWLGRFLAGVASRLRLARLRRHFAMETDDCEGSQVGFGRVVSDYTVFSWVADIVIEPRFRGRGLGKWMMSCIKEHPQLRHTQMVLQTRDAHSLYEAYGFSRNPALMSTKVDGL